MLENLKKIYERNPSHPWQTISESTVILSTEGMMSYELSGAGYYIWENLNGKNSLDDIIKLLYEEFEVTQDQAKEDLIDFIQTLEDQGLINCQK